MKHTIILAMLLLAVEGWGQVSTGKDQFVSRVGLSFAGGSGHAYGKYIEGAPWYSFIGVGAFVDWQTRYAGFKTTALWTTYEGGSFQNGTLSLEFLPKIQEPSTGIYAGVGLYTLLNAPSTAKSGIGLAAEIGWQRGPVMLALRVRSAFSDQSAELDGRQRSVEFGGGVCYSIIGN